MPWTARQNKLFRAAEHNPAIARDSGIPQATAARLAHEGIKKARGGSLTQRPPLFQQAHLMHGRGDTQIPSSIDALSGIPSSAGNIRARLQAALAARGSSEGSYASGAAASLAIPRNAAGIGLGPQEMLSAYAPDDYKSAIYSTFPDSNTLTGQYQQRFKNLEQQYNPTPMPYARGGVTSKNWPTSKNPHLRKGASKNVYCGGGVPRFGDGGDVPEGHVPPAAIAGITGAAALGALGRRVGLSGIEGIARPLLRALSRPALTVEAVSKLPLTEAQSDARFKLARRSTGSSMDQFPVTKGQGAWMGDNGMEYNPLYMQGMPRTWGRVRDQAGVMRYAGQMGENLEQAATPVSRFVPNLINKPTDANALMASTINRARLKLLSDALGPDVVTAHRPGNKAMVFDPMGGDIQSLADKVKAAMPDAPLRYGRSDPLVDRVLLARKPLGYEDALYSDVGAQPRTQAYTNMERSFVDNPRGSETHLEVYPSSSGWVVSQGGKPWGWYHSQEAAETAARNIQHAIDQGPG